MKQFIHDDYIKDVIILSALIIVALIIWLFGPLIVINNQYILEAPAKRFYIISLLFLLFTLKFILTHPQKNLSVPKSTESLTQWENLKGRFEGAIQFLKKTSLNKQGKNFSLAQLPWYFLIGPTYAGKTTLLANANINYILTKQFKQEKIYPSDSCDWWVTRDLILVDIPGSYINSNDTFLWEKLFHLMQQHRLREKLAGVVIALPFPELIKQQNLKQKKQIVATIKQKIQAIQEHFSPHINFYFVITKCDLLPGFLEFFSEYGTEELAQHWGISLPICKENENIYDIFNQRFNELIKRLNNQLIIRLHQERNANARSPIKDFPLQVERLKETIHNFLKALAIPNLRLQGLYLTSALQVNGEDQSLLNNSNMQQLTQLLRYPTMPSKAYFIKQLILQGLLNRSVNHVIKTASKKWVRQSSYAAAAVFTLLTCMWLGYDFQQSVIQTYAIQNNLAQYQLAIQQEDQHGDHLLKALPLLNASQKAAKSTLNFSRLSNILSFYADKSQQTANVVYQKALETIVLPEIKKDFETYLKTAGNKNPVQLYAVLKAYLMLQDNQNLNSDYVITTLKQLLPNSISQKASLDLNTHVHEALQKKSSALKINNNLITHARNQLANLSSPDLAFVILKNMDNNNQPNNINFTNNSNIIVNKQTTNKISTLFTAEKFSQVLSQEIPLAATEALQGNWVLGTSDVLSNEATINELIQALRANYLTSYINTWENLIANINLETPNNLVQSDALILDLIGNTSPLLQLMQIIKQNTAFSPLIGSSSKIQALNNLLINANNNQQSTLYQAFVALRQLHFYLATILNTNDVNGASFEAAKNRTMQIAANPISQVHLLAEQSPEPMKTWLNNLAGQCWYYILQNAAQYIENAWQVNITTVYHSQFANRYPINQGSTEEIDIQQLVNFVGKEGTFANFYLNYLKPFVNEDNKQWQWRLIDNQKIPYSNEVLQEIQQTCKLQHVSKYMLFSQGRNSAVLQNFHLPEKLLE